MSNVTFRIASLPEHPRVQAAYTTWGYRSGISPDDILYVAERGGEFVAAVRRTQEHGLVLLRGMHVAPEQQRKGIGSRLLGTFVEHLHGEACYCVPYQHLRAFYSRAGFASLPDHAAPEFLRERVRSYRTRGLDVFVMHRPASLSMLPRERPNQAMQATAVVGLRYSPSFLITSSTSLSVRSLMRSSSSVSLRSWFKCS